MTTGRSGRRSFTIGGGCGSVMPGMLMSETSGMISPPIRPSSFIAWVPIGADRDPGVSEGPSISLVTGSHFRAATHRLTQLAVRN
jgi:hypothetical protein